MSKSLKHTSASPGANSRAEILSQPERWSLCLEELNRSGKLPALAEKFSSSREWVFSGCGSSYYVALAAAATMTRLTGLRARAVPASEIVLYPDMFLAGSQNCLPVLISRSGQTSEAVAAAEVLKNRGIATLAITCSPGQPLEQAAAETIVLAHADEQSTVMTRSFTSMLLALQALAAQVLGNADFPQFLSVMAGSLAPAVPSITESVARFVDAHTFADYVYLGQGPFYGLACEGALKITEMSVSYAQAFHTLEFRHGPKSIVSPETLLVFLLSEGSHQAECEALEEMKSLGATTVVVTNHVVGADRASADLLVELHLDVPEFARLAAYVLVPQLLGLFTGLKKGLDPDSPRNLSRVVLLNGDKPRLKPEHASI